MDGATNRFEGTESDATEELDARLREAVKLRMEADVPLGALLSGGVDSSTIVALMQAQSHRRVKTFTIGFDDSQYNEAHHAKAVAEYLGTEHTELRVSQREMLAVVPYLPTIYDEPFGDSSQIPTYLVSAIARRAVVVGLTGDGADELFAGYDVYPRLRSLWNVRRAIPDWLAASASDLAGVMCDWTRLTALRRGTDRWPLVGSVAIGRTLRRLSQFLASPTPEAIHRDLRAHAGAEHLAAASTEPATAFSDVDEWLDLRDPVERAMHLDVISYLPDDILVKVDRASMAVSLEARAPFLDHTLAEFVWRLPMSMKRRGPSGKRILRLVLAKYVPGRLVERPKMGFVAPLHSWLRGPLKEWAAELLSEARLDSYGLFDTAAILRTWADYLGGNDIWQSYLWNVLMFQAWMECDEARRASKVSGSASLVAANLLASPCIKD
jgi:asparagine synthase (glutamine-hydrolysing)